MMQVGKAVGMVSLNDALLELVTKKLVAPEEAYAKAVDKSAFRGGPEARRIAFDPRAEGAARDRVGERPALHGIENGAGSQTPQLRVSSAIAPSLDTNPVPKPPNPLPDSSTG